MSHHYFTLADRYRIQIGLEDKYTQQKIADSIGATREAVGQEIRRNSFVFEAIQTTRVNRPSILNIDLRTRRGKGEVPNKEERFSKDGPLKTSFCGVILEYAKSQYYKN